jgi:uncharacterized protein YjiS (DUF1127 family)
MLILLMNALKRHLSERRRRARLRLLLTRDNNILEDIGLRRSEILISLELPMDQDARKSAYLLSERSLALDGRG